MVTTAQLESRVTQLEHLREEDERRAGAPLFSVLETLAADMAALRQALTETSTRMSEEMTALKGDLSALQDQVATWQTGQEAELAVLRRALGASSSIGAPSKFKVPNPKSFAGDRSAKELENFLWDMEQYFAAARIPEAEMVSVTSMYLTGDAKLWWRTRLQEDASAGRPRIDTWGALRRELREQFLPNNTSWNAREGLKKLKHTGSVREYVKAFTSLLLDITNMSEEDKIFNFMSGLQSWAQTELRRQGVKDLPAYIAAAEALVDFRQTGAPSLGDKGKAKNKGKETVQPSGKDNGATAEKGGATSKGPKNGGCFLCGGPHRMRECPMKAAVNAIIAEETGRSERGSDEEVRLSPLQLTT